MLFGTLAATLMVGPAWAHQRVTQIDPPYLVEFQRGFEPGTIVIESQARLLHLVETGQMARRYMIGVGRIGLGWSGRRVVGRKAEWPSWRPTDRMIRREPEKYARYAAGVPGGPKNPLGARALYYRIHGTNEPWTIGRAVSNGCFRLLNEHVIDLYDRVPVGTPVVVIG
jgi:lipoprotein-anchoring transpeptidase ErfK/SrfK